MNKREALEVADDIVQREWDKVTALEPQGLVPFTTVRNGGMFIS